MENFDLYTIKARLLPAIIALVPAIAFIIAILNLQSFDASQIWASIGLTVILYVCANIAREAGRRVQADVYRENDGWPTFEPLFYSDTTFSDNAKLRYLNFLSGKIGLPVPSMADVVEQPMMARDFYSQAATWLRENTRDITRFKLIYEENTSYGFYRNMLGLKGIGIFFNIMTSLGCILIVSGVVTYFSGSAERLKYVLFVSLVHFLYLIFGVRRSLMMKASSRYARQLLLACDTLDGKP